MITIELEFGDSCIIRITAEQSDVKEIINSEGFKTLAKSLAETLSNLSLFKKMTTLEETPTEERTHGT